MRKIVLASASPRRKELLQKIGLKFEVDVSNCAEEIDPALKPDEIVRRISIEKAHAVASRHKDAVIIAADTIGVIGTKLLGKPHTVVEARKMLAQISGKSHEVITGFTVLDTAVLGLSTVRLLRRANLLRFCSHQLSAGRVP